MVKEAASQYPDNYRLRMFYAIILGDIEHVSNEVEKEFLNAVRIAVDLDKEVFSGWPEEDVCYHLGIDAAQRGNGWKAAFFYLCSALITDGMGKHELFKLKETYLKNEESYKEIIDRLKVTALKRGLITLE